MPPATEPDPSVLAERFHEDTKPLDAPMPRPFPLSGALLGPGVRLQRCIGEGASSLVYQGFDLDGSPVAVKVLRYRAGPSAQRRFVQEFDVLARVRSPHVVRARRRGELPDGRPWHAMDYVAGRSLAERLAHGWRPEPDHVVRLLRMACRGLAAVHAAGFVHHDVKPSNLLLQRRGRIEHLVVVDLGVAEAIGRRPRQMCGTPDYMAPEQAQTGPVDVRSDVYGLGCCAYELLTGRKLVRGSDASEKIREHLHGVVARWPGTLALAPELRRIVERCLVRDPKEREPSMLTLEHALARVAGELPPRRRSRPKRERLGQRTRRSASCWYLPADPVDEARTVTVLEEAEQTLESGGEARSARTREVTQEAR